MSEPNGMTDQSLSNDDLLEIFRVTALDLLIVWARERTLVARGMPEAEAMKNCSARSGLQERLQGMTPQVFQLMNAHGCDTSLLHDFQYHAFVSGDYSAAKATWQQVSPLLSSLGRDIARGARKPM